MRSAVFDHDPGDNSPFSSDNFAESVHHAVVVFCTRSGNLALQHQPGLDSVKRVEQQQLRHTGDGTGGELAVEGQRYSGM